MTINCGYYYTNRKINAAQLHSLWKKKSPLCEQENATFFSMKMYHCYYSFGSLKDIQAGESGIYKRNYY